MPELTGTLKPPRLASAPGSPTLGQMYANTATNKLMWWNGTAWVAAEGAGATKPPLVTSLPGSPADGDECYYQNAAMASAGIAWHLRYRAASASSYKWEALSAGELTAHNGAWDNFTTLATWGSTLFPTPTLTLPLAGEYIMGSEFTGTPSVSVADFRVQPYLGGTLAFAASDSWAACMFNVSARSVPAAYAAGGVLRLEFLASAATAFTAYNRVLWARPVRVG